MEDKLLEQFLQSPRFKHIRETKKLATKHNRCKEKVSGKCMYPHCNCLFGINGHIDPVTGKEVEE